MTLRDRLVKNGLFFVVVVYYLGGYFLIDYWSAGRKDLHHLALPFEANLPLWPALIFAYLMIFVFLAIPYLAIDDLPFFKKTARAFFVCITIHFLFFLAFPVECNLRPVVDPDRGWAYLLVYFYYWLDPPYNCFPSMHISNVFLISFLMNRYRPGLLCKLLYPVAALVAIAVVLVKQHFIVDVVAGFFVGWLVDRWVFR